MAELAAQRYELVDIDLLEPHPQNPRKGDLPALSASIAANGFYGAVVAQSSTGHILAGNHRWLAAKREGLHQIPVIWLDCAAPDALRILAVDNRANDRADYDQESLLALLTEIRSLPAGLVGSGYDESSFEAIVKAAGDAAMAAAAGAGSGGGSEDQPANQPAEEAAQVCPTCGRAAN